MRKLFIALVMGSALLPLDGFTLGLGGIEVNSALNQELDAEIELLSAVPEDTETMIVKLATREEFSRAGLDRPFMLQSLKFGSKIKNGVPYITVTTSKPIREPFLNFLVEVDWPKGHLLREYTILLDPPVFMGQESAARPAVSDSRPAAASAVRPTDTSSRPAYSTTPAVTPAPAPQSQASPAAAPAPRASYTPAGNADYRIKKGDTAWSLADALRPDQSVSVEQMMLAMLRTNPESFINDNVNGLKRGYILRVPDRNEITSVSQAEAVALVRQQHALWREYQQAVSSAKPSSSLAESAAGGTASANAKADARLSIVSAGKGGAATGTAGNLDGMSVEELRAQLALAEERLETERVEKESLQGEVEILESQVNRMKRLLSIEDVSLAEMQAAAGGEVAEGMDAPLATDESDELLTSAEDAMPSEDMPLEEMPAEETSALAEGEAESEMAQTDEQAQDVFVDEQQAAQEMMDAAPMQETYVDEAPVIDYVQPSPQGLVAQLLNNPLVLAAAGGGLLLIMGLVYMIVKRRRGHASAMAAAPVAAATSSVLDEDDDLASVADMIDDKAVSQQVSDEEVEASMAAAEEAAEKFDSDATLVMSPSAEDTIVTQAAPAEEARDDIIAEADVYLAYGIYQQAEELLQNAIKEHPENDAYRMKLAETHFASKNASAFGELATEMHKRTGGSGASWTKIAAMGADLIPDHALFKGADMVGDLALDDLVPSAAPEMDFDLGAEAATDEVADLDFSLDDDSSSDASLPDLENTPASAEEELEFDLSDAEAVKLDDAAPAEDEFSLDIEASELDITSDEADKDTAADMDFDLDLSDEAAAPAADTAADMDFDLDLSNEVEEVAQSVSDTASVSTDTDDGSDIDLSDLDDVDEVSTKLD
ncbi:MAG: FimV/HubP family polar landmark protein, partial [Gammaproteobacteria bacterium]